MNSPQKYRLSPSWRIDQTDSSLEVFGGGDAKYEIELESTTKSYFSDLSPDSQFTRNQLNDTDQKVLEQLVTAEVIVPTTPETTNLKVVQIGDKLPFDLTFGDSVSRVGEVSDCDLIVIVRYKTTHLQLLENINYRAIDKPHVYIDAAYHHTLSIGPLVYPTETSCVACLQGRLYERWGEDVPVEMPAVTADFSQLIQAVVQSELDRIASGETSLVAKTVSWNFAERSISSERLLKVSVCPVCSVSAMKTGKILLE